MSVFTILIMTSTAIASPVNARWVMGRGDMAPPHHMPELGWVTPKEAVNVAFDNADSMAREICREEGKQQFERVSRVRVTDQHTFMEVLFQILCK